MLLTPAGLQSIAQASIFYSGLDTRHWTEGNRTIQYAYDDNGSLTSKITTVTSTQEELETITYEYNIQNRMERTVREYDDLGNTINEVTEYTYNPDGIRIKSYYYKTINGGAKQDEQTKIFLIDAYNHTGYSQVLEETTGSNTTTYTIGDDVITQYEASAGAEHLLYDGHGSTRQTVDSSGTVTDCYSYDAYGVTLGSPASTTTNLLYAGEMYDSATDSYYLRSRYYFPATGTFNRLDPFQGNLQDPQSLHKYLYAHCNPVNNIDPSGEITIPQIIFAGIIAAILGVLLGLGVHRLITYTKYRYRVPSQAERDIVEMSAIPNAKRLVNIALMKLRFGHFVSSTSYALYNTWFGRFTLSRYEKVVETFAKIQNYLNTGFKWRTFTSDRYKGFYIKGIDLVLFSDPLFYRDAPDLPAKNRGDREHTKAEIVIHELAHKAGVRRSEGEMETYGISSCKYLAQNYPQKSLNNADNYAFYASGTQ